MILSVSINLFDGEELLAPLLRTLRPEVDHISIVYQRFSYRGVPCAPSLPRRLRRLRDAALVDAVDEYDSSDGRIPPQGHEVRKRNRGLELARRAGATHYMSLDVDEFFHAPDLRYAKQVVEREGYDATACRIQGYHRKAVYRERRLSDFLGYDLYVPLIYAVRDEARFVFDIPFFCTVDNTRRMPFHKAYCFRPDELLMHHMSTVRRSRRSLVSKFLNRSTLDPHDRPGKQAADVWDFRPERGGGPELDVVPDVFGIGPLEDDERSWSPASLWHECRVALFRIRLDFARRRNGP
jgi:hypothetical protein